MNKLNVIYEDKFILIINKQAGLIVNRADTTRNIITLQDLVEKYLGSSLKKNTHNPLHITSNPSWESPEDAFINRTGIVHRLDKETSGVMVIGKTLDAFTFLQKEFKEREVTKTYLALVHGKVIPEKGEINAPVGRMEFNRKQFGVVAGGRESETHYRVIDYYTNDEILSLVELSPKTGRTHQIRVHMKYIGHPLFADELYAGRKVAKGDRKFLPRIFLHAEILSLIHPITQKRMEFVAELPNDLQEFLEKLKKLS